MDNLSLSAISRPAATITGSIFIKRKMFWAERYARIKDRKLAYYEDKADSVPRAVLHLANAELVEGVNGRDDLYELRLRSGAVQSLFIKIENKSFRQRFISCLQQNIKPTQSTIEEQPSCELDQEGELGSKLPELPPMYQYVLEDKFTVKRCDTQYSYSELYHKRKKEKHSRHHTQSQDISYVHVTLLLLLCFLVSEKPFNYMFLTVACLCFLYGYISTRKKSTRIKETILLKQPIMDVLHTLKHRRREIYVHCYDEIEYQQVQFRGQSKLFVVETERERLKYFWELFGFGNEVLVSVYYDTNAPEIQLQLLPILVASVRIDEAMKGLNTTAGKQLSKMLSQDTFKDDKVLGSFKSEASSPVRKLPLSEITEEIGLLPPMEGLIKQFPEVPKDLLQELLTSRERFLAHMNSPWDNKQVDKECTMYVKDIGRNLATKGQTVVKGNMEKIVEYLLDIEKRPEYDKMYNSGRILKDYGSGIGIVYQKFNGIFPVSSRDFVILLSKEKIENGYMLHTKSIPYDYPADGKSVRAIAISAGFEVKEVSPGMMRVTYLTESDLCGDLPGIVRRKAGSMQSRAIITLREALLKRFK